MKSPTREENEEEFRKRSEEMKKLTATVGEVKDKSKSIRDFTHKRKEMLKMRKVNQEESMTGKV